MLTQHLLLLTCLDYYMVSYVSFSLGQSRNWTYSQQQRLMSQRQNQEQLRQQEARRVDRERQLQAGVRDEENSEKRRYLRQVQDELKERQMESALLKVLYVILLCR